MHGIGENETGKRNGTRIMRKKAKSQKVKKPLPQKSRIRKQCKNQSGYQRWWCTPAICSFPILSFSIRPPHQALVRSDMEKRKRKKQAPSISYTQTPTPKSDYPNINCLPSIPFALPFPNHPFASIIKLFFLLNPCAYQRTWP